MTQPTDTPPAAARVAAPAPAPDDDPAGTAQDRMLAGPPRQRAARKRRAVAVTPAMLEGAPEFAPVPRQHARYDGWTPERQRAFIKLLAEYGCVVTVRLLPCGLGFDGFDDVGVIDKILEKLIPLVGGLPCSGDHVAQLVDTIVGKSGATVVRGETDADDRAVGQVIVIADDGIDEVRVLPEHVSDIVEHEDVSDACHEMAFLTARAGANSTA